MVKSCCAVGCTNRFKKGSGVTFYRFPEDEQRRLRWIAAVGRKDWLPSEYTWLCSDHFLSGCKSNDPLSPDYIPSVFAHIASPQKRKAIDSMARFRRNAEVKKRRRENTARLEAAESLVQLCDEGNGEVYCEPHTGTASMTDLSMKDVDDLLAKQCELQSQITELQEERDILRDDNCKLVKTCDDLKKIEGDKDKNTLKEESLSLKKDLDLLHFTEASLEDNNKMIKYYTGLPDYHTLKSVYEFVFPVPQDSRSSLTTFQQFCAVLMKFRLGLGDQDLAYRFGVDQSTMSRYIKKNIDILYIRLQPLVKWPERPELMETMPVDFRKHFSACVTIIDCFEVFVERPTSLKARAQTWSNYKHHNTIKFLIGIAPQGVITFISKGWGGRVSDVYLTEHCGLLEKLLPGDLVLADRGFNIHESAGLYCAQVKLPPFTRGKPQLTKSEVDFSRQLSRVRIHVERVIGLLRQKYSIFESTIPINFIMTSENESTSPIDKIAAICCALCNLCPSVVSS